MLIGNIGHYGVYVSNMTFIVADCLYSDEVCAIETDRLRLSVLKKGGYPKVYDYVVRNREFHKEFSQPQADSYFTRSVQKQYVEADAREFRRGAIVPMWITVKGDRSKIIGRVSLFNIARGGMMLAQLGYHLDKDSQGQGYMTEAVKGVCGFAFEVMNLHRIEAFILPENDRSLALIKNCGFVYEGTRHSYMNINGRFRDHETFYLLRPQ